MELLNMRYKIIFFLILTICITAFAQNQKSVQDNNYGKNTTLTINSTPLGADVIIDGKNLGKTPFTIVNPTSNVIHIKLILNGISRERQVGIVNSSQEVFFVMDGNYGLLNITTEPKNAQAFINDTLIGSTPVYNHKVPLGKLKLTLKKYEYFDGERTFFVTPTKYDVNIPLQSKFSSIQYNESYPLFLDDIPSKKTGIFKIPVGEHNLSVKPDGFYKIISKDVEFNSDENYKIEISYGYFTPKYILYSMILPGLGQYSDNTEIKGIGFFAGTLISAILYSSSVSNYNEKANRFNKAMYNYQRANDETSAQQYKNILDSSLNQLNDATKKKNLMLGITLGIYGLNLLDAILFHTSGSNIEILKIVKYNPTKSQVGIKLNLN